MLCLANCRHYTQITTEYTVVVGTGNTEGAINQLPSVSHIPTKQPMSRTIDTVGEFDRPKEWFDDFLNHRGWIHFTELGGKFDKPVA